MRRTEEQAKSQSAQETKKTEDGGETKGDQRWNDGQKAETAEHVCSALV